MLIWLETKFLFAMRNYTVFLILGHVIFVKVNKRKRGVFTHVRCIAILEKEKGVE